LQVEAVKKLGMIRAQAGCQFNQVRFACADCHVDSCRFWNSRSNLTQACDTYAALLDQKLFLIGDNWWVGYRYSRTVQPDPTSLGGIRFNRRAYWQRQSFRDCSGQRSLHAFFTGKRITNLWDKSG
jgi:hypothetical protein